MKHFREAKVIDIFCGIGGLTNGLAKAGLNVVAGYDIDSSCKFAYETNNNAIFINKDIRCVTAQELNDLYGETKFKILVGCAPCQPFSSHSNKNRINNFSKNDERWKLLDEFAKVIKLTMPDVVSMENVPQLTKFNIFQEFISTLESLSYNVIYQIIDCSELGLPQSRKRLVLLASKKKCNSLNFDMHYLFRKSTVRKTIGHLEKITNGGISHKDNIHQSSKLSELNLKRMLSSKAGGTWKDWPIELLPACYRKESGKSYGAVYGRMEWDKPSPTITTQFNTFGTGRFGHPDQNRAISLREGALLQGFPDEYQFVKASGKFSTRTIARHIGNAVPPPLGLFLGKIIINILLEE